MRSWIEFVDDDDIALFPNLRKSGFKERSCRRIESGRFVQKGSAFVLRHEGQQYLRHATIP